MDRDISPPSSSSPRGGSRGGSPRHSNNGERSNSFVSNGSGSNDNGGNNNDNGGSGNNNGSSGGGGSDGNGVYGWENTYPSDDPSIVDANNTAPVVHTLPEEVSFLKTFFPHSHCLYVDPATITMRADLKDHPFQTAAAILPGGEC